MSDIDRRKFLKGGTAILAGTVIAPGITLIQVMAGENEESRASAKNRWGMVIDVNRCTEECTECIQACRTENNVPLFGDKRFDAYWIRKVKVTPKIQGAKSFSLPLLCNHCEYPPCQHVCPVGATFTRKDGIVLIDKHICIGCRYCMIACPYKARSFVFRKTTQWTNKDVPKRSKGVVEKCNFCVHLVDKGELPACVDACNKSGEKAMLFGNLNDPESEIYKYLREHAPQGLRVDLGLKPKVFYRGLNA